MSGNEGLSGWLDGAAFVDERGAPVVWYHGTDWLEPFNVFSRWDEASIGFHFGTREVANYRVADMFRMGPPGEAEATVIPVICRARNPLRLPDLYCWGQQEIASALFEAGVLRSEEEWDHVVDSCSEEAIFAALEEAGYDAVVYGNECEHKEEVTDSILVWRAELLRSPFARSFDPDDPRLLPDHPTPADEGDLAMWRDLGLRIDEARAELRGMRMGFAANP